MKILFLAILVLALMPAISGSRVAADAALPDIQTAALYSSAHSALMPEDHFGAISAHGISASSVTQSGLTRPVQFNQFMFLLLFLLVLVAGVEFGLQVQAGRSRPSDTTESNSA